MSWLRFGILWVTRQKITRVRAISSAAILAHAIDAVSQRDFVRVF